MKQTGGQTPGSVLRAMEVHARFTFHDRNVKLSADEASRAGRSLQLKMFVSDTFPIEGRLTRPNPQDLKRVSPIHGQVGLQRMFTPISSSQLLLLISTNLLIYTQIQLPGCRGVANGEDHLELGSCAQYETTL